MSFLQELLVRTAGVAVIIGGAVYALRLVAKRLFPKVDNDLYLGGKPSEKQDSLWMD